jgi:hypothetical protein
MIAASAGNPGRKNTERGYFSGVLAVLVATGINSGPLIQSL